MAVSFIGGGNRSTQRKPPKTDRHDITEILLKVALNTINYNQHSEIDNILKEICNNAETNLPD
jgi:hypothetical protein